jgi:hypothetical protein
LEVGLVILEYSPVVGLASAEMVFVRQVLVVVFEKYLVVVVSSVVVVALLFANHFVVILVVHMLLQEINCMLFGMGTPVVVAFANHFVVALVVYLLLEMNCMLGTSVLVVVFLVVELVHL